MTDIEDSLIEEILASPDDDTPRLVYADWLSSQGDPRGEFIQLQCRRTAGEPNPLPTREGEILQANERKWLSTFYSRVKVTWSRGFIDSIECNAAPFVENLRTILRMAPAARVSLVKVTPAHCEAMGREPLVRVLRDLSLVFPGWSGKAGAIFASPHLTGLRRLRASLQYGAAGIQMLRETRSLGALLELDLDATSTETMHQMPAEMTAKQLAAVTRAPFFPKLTRLVLDNNVAIDDALEELERGVSLRSLSLERCQLSDKKLASLLSSEAVQNLEEIHLEGNNVGRETAEALLHSPHLARLRRIDRPGGRCSAFSFMEEGPAIHARYRSW